MEETSTESGEKGAGCSRQSAVVSSPLLGMWGLSLAVVPAQGIPFPEASQG